MKLQLSRLPNQNNQQATVGTRCIMEPSYRDLSPIWELNIINTFEAHSMEQNNGT